MIDEHSQPLYTYCLLTAWLKACCCLSWSCCPMTVLWLHRLSCTIGVWERNAHLLLFAREKKTMHTSLLVCCWSHQTKSLLFFKQITCESETKQSALKMLHGLYPSSRWNKCSVFHISDSAGFTDFPLFQTSSLPESIHPFSWSAVSTALTQVAVPSVATPAAVVSLNYSSSFSPLHHISPFLHKGFQIYVMCVEYIQF